MNNLTRRQVTAFKHKVSRRERNALDAYQRAATKTAVYPGHGTPLGLAYVSLKLNGEAGEFAEHVGKAMRDDELIKFYGLPSNHVPSRREMFFQPLTPERRAFLIKEAGDILWYLSASCNELGIKLSEVASGNLEKLYSRQRRGKLAGSGDNR